VARRTVLCAQGSRKIAFQSTQVIVCMTGAKSDGDAAVDISPEWGSRGVLRLPAPCGLHRTSRSSMLFRTSWAKKWSHATINVGSLWKALHSDPFLPITRDRFAEVSLVTCLRRPPFSNKCKHSVKNNCLKAFPGNARLAAQCREIRFSVADVLCDALDRLQRCRRAPCLATASGWHRRTTASE
jgi:hypothetical protein